MLAPMRNLVSRYLAWRNAPATRSSHVAERHIAIEVKSGHMIGQGASDTPGFMTSDRV